MIKIEEVFIGENSTWSSFFICQTSDIIRTNQIKIPVLCDLINKLLKQKKYPELMKYTVDEGHISQYKFGINHMSTKSEF